MLGFEQSGKGVLCFGELLLRLSPDIEGNWLREQQLSCFVGGAELNVATALALWEIPVDYCTALPDNLLTAQLIASVAARHIGTEKIILAGSRIGLYYLPQGTDVKNAGVIYDRADSAFAGLEPGTVNWQQVFAGISWFHLTAICPAVSESAAAVCLEAVKYASSNGISISLDLNYRAKLWQYGKQPLAVLPEIAGYCDLIMGNIWAADLMLGVDLSASFQSESENLKADANQKSKNVHLDQAKLSSGTVFKKFPKCKLVAFTFRFDAGAEGVNYYTSLHEPSVNYHSATYSTDKIVDKVGSGDCFMAGLIYGLYHGHSPRQTLDFAASAAFNKLFIASDSTNSKIQDIYASILPHDTF